MVDARPSIAGPWRWTGLIAATLIAASAPLWRLAGNEWRFTLPGLPHDGRKPFTTVIFLVSAGVLALSWLLLLRRVERSTAPERDRTRAVLLTCALWFVPVLLGPPLLSSDVYSYAAQGEMVTKGFDPTSEGMYRLQTGEYVSRVDPLWRKPAVGNGYGPVQMGVAAVAATITDHHALDTVLVLRIVAALGVGLAAWGLVQIARNVGLDPPTMLVLAIANPIVVLHIVGGGHNDGLLMGLLFAGVALAQRGRWWWGVALLAMAAAVKLPAAAALPYLAWCRPGRRAPWQDRVRSTVQTGIASIGVILAWSVVVGVSLGWINSMRNAATLSKGTLAITTQLGYIVSDSLNSLGVGTNSDYWIDTFRMLGMGVIAILAIWLLWRSPSIGALRATGLCMLAMVMFGPVVWPWYLAPAIAMLAVTNLARWRASLMVLTTVFACEVFPSSPGGTVPDHNHLASMLVIVAIGAIALLLPWVQTWWAAAKEPPSTAVALAD